MCRGIVALRRLFSRSEPKARSASHKLDSHFFFGAHQKWTSANSLPYYSSTVARGACSCCLLPSEIEGSCIKNVGRLAGGGWATPSFTTDGAASAAVGNFSRGGWGKPRP